MLTYTTQYKLLDDDAIKGSVEVLEDGVPVASCGFLGRRWDDPVLHDNNQIIEIGALEAGILIVYSEESYGRGIGTFAVRAAFEEAKNVARQHSIRVPRIYASTGQENQGTIKIFEDKMGFRFRKDSTSYTLRLSTNLSAHATIDVAKKYGLRPLRL